MRTAQLVIERASNKSIVADVTYKEDGQKKPLVIFSHGYKGFKDWGCWNVLAKEMAKAGIFFFKFNFSHNGGTVENPIDFPDLEAFGLNNFTKELNDLDSVLSFVCNGNFPFANEVDTTQITLVGHSRGGGVVILKAAEDERVQKVVSIAGVCDFKKRFPNGEQLEQWKKHGVAYIENTRTKQQMPHYIQFYEDFVANEERLTIARAVQELNIPQLIIHGTVDEIVGLEEAQALHQWNNESELFVVEDANHVFGGMHPWKSDSLPEHLVQVCQKLVSFVNNP